MELMLEYPFDHACIIAAKLGKSTASCFTHRSQERSRGTCSHASGLSCQQHAICRTVAQPGNCTAMQLHAPTKLIGKQHIPRLAIVHGMIIRNISAQASEPIQRSVIHLPG